jgi:hypothetical protein
MRTCTRRRALSLLGAALAISVLGTLAGPAQADPTPGEGSAGPIPPQPTSISADVMVLHATNDNSGIDRTLGPMPVLSKPPFSAYNSYKLLSRTGGIALPRGVVAAPLKLPTGRELHVVYKNALPPAKEGGVGRYVIGASIETPSGKTTLPLLEVNARAGEWFWVGGQDYKGGALFIAIRINS